MTDPISDFFVRIKNAQKAGHQTVQIPYSKFKHEIARALERSGLVGGVEEKGRRMRVLELALLYHNRVPVLGDVKLFSTPSRRLYTPYRTIPSARRGGMILLTTPKGVLNHREARKEKVGGQLLAELW